MRPFIGVCFFAFMLASCSSSPPANRDPGSATPARSGGDRDPFEVALVDLTDQIVQGLEDRKAAAVAVAPFRNLDGGISRFGGLLAEEMTTRLHRTSSLRVVERELLGEVLTEHQLALSGLLDESTVKELGKLLSVDVIAVGTITDLGTRLRVNSRLISTETGSVFAAAATTFAKNEGLEELMADVLQSPAEQDPGTGDSGRGDPDPAADPRHDPVVFHEDFSTVAEGMIPAGWTGGRTLAVQRQQGGGGRSTLRPFQKGSHRFSILDLEFPQDWKMSAEIMLMKHSSFHKVSQMWRVGDLEVQLFTGWVRVADDWFEAPIPSGQEIRFEIEKTGPVIKLFIDGKRIHLLRKDGFPAPRSIVFQDRGEFELYSLRVEELP